MWKKRCHNQANLLYDNQSESTSNLQHIRLFMIHIKAKYLNSLRKYYQIQSLEIETEQTVLGHFVTQKFCLHEL